MVLSPSPQQVCSNDYASANKETVTECLDRTSAEGVAYYTQVLAGFTAVVAIVSGLQIYFLMRADQAATKALISARRAYLFCDGYKAFADPPPAGKGYHWRFRPVWRNTGETPPVGLEQYAECEVRTAPYPAGHLFVPSSSIRGVGGVIIPKGSSMGGLSPSYPQPGITPQDIADVQGGKKLIYLWGFAKYFTEFDRKTRHTTHFCFVLNPAGKGDVAKLDALRWDYIYHTEGNYIREEGSGNH